MKKILLLAALVAGTAFAGERQIINPDQDGNLVLKVNDGGTVTEALRVNGALSTVSVGGTSSSSSATLNIYRADATAYASQAPLATTIPMLVKNDSGHVSGGVF